MSLRILRIRDVMQATGMSRATIYRKVSAKQFPAPVGIGGTSVGWREHEVDAWIAALEPVPQRQESAA